MLSLPQGFFNFSLGSKYPTKTEILTDPPKIKAATINFVKDWKENLWNKESTEEIKFNALKILVQALAIRYGKPVPNVVYQPTIASCCYQPHENTIIINQSLSIISTLHETAHMLFGSSEKRACRWSVAIFQQVFPRAYARLEWQGHLLIKKPKVCPSTAPSPSASLETDLTSNSSDIATIAGN